VNLRKHEIAETYHRILNPLLEEQLRTIGDAAEVGPATRVLDLCCGKGEMICRWAEWYGSLSLGVDLSEVFVAVARKRARELGVDARVEIAQGEAAAFAKHLAEREPASFEVVSCLGATWIGGGLAGTLDLMRPLVIPGGAIIVGEPFLEEPIPAEGLAAFGFAPDDYVSLDRTVDRFAAAGLEVEEMIAAGTLGWERYEAPQWRAIARFLAAHPDDPDRDELRAFLEEGRRNYATWGRRYLGWAVFVARPRADAR
jgi:SAM-dependent methyltransferase